MGVYFGLLFAFYIAFIISHQLEQWTSWCKNIETSGIYQDLELKMEVYMIYREKHFQGFFLQIPEQTHNEKASSDWQEL